MTDKEQIISIFNEAQLLKQQMQQQDSWSLELMKAIHFITDSYRAGGKLLLCGNGGSAADAQHIAAELSGRFRLNRQGLFAEALHTNGSYLTAVANDYGFDEIYARLVDAIGNEKDILLAISTSGNSKNILRAIEVAKSKKIKIIGFGGKDGGEMKNWCDIYLGVPHQKTERIQEIHILWGHILCELVEEKLFGQNK
ncbi:MAG: D-sedoheptulose 7-phosphate isomerase [Chitinophagaceae bacterium]|nr:MAG: D-sedoheptulose 7-phosphate isomerase [Chitinophagaceae bacterium]